MKLQQVQKLSPSELEQIVNLQLKILPDSIINKVGKKFLELVYSFSVKDKDRILIILKDNDKVIGFALTSRNTHNFYRKIVGQNRPGAYLLMAAGFLKDPPLFVDAVKWSF